MNGFLQNSLSSIYKIPTTTMAGYNKNKLQHSIIPNLLFILAAFTMIKLVSQKLINPLIPALYFLSIIAIAINMKRFIKNYRYKKN